MRHDFLVPWLPNKIKVHTVAMQERHCVGIYFWHRKKRVNRIPKVDTCSYSGKMHKLRNLSCHKKELNNKRWMNQSNILAWTAPDQCASNLAPEHGSAKSRWRKGGEHVHLRCERDIKQPYNYNSQVTFLSVHLIFFLRWVYIVTKYILLRYPKG